MPNGQVAKPNEPYPTIDPVRLSTAIENLLQNMTGMKITINKRRVQKSLKPKIDRLRSLLQESNLADLWKLDEDERKRLFVRFISTYLRIIFDLPKEQDPIELMISGVSNFFEADKDYTFLKNTRYNEYKERLFMIVRIIYSDNQKLRSVKFLSRSIPAKELFETSQQALGLSKTADFLQKDHKRLTEAIVRKYISAYHDLCAYMEKITQLFVAIQGILKGNNVKLSEIKKYNTSNNVKALKSDARFRGLVTPFNITVWNACKHPGVFIEPSTKRVMFTDNQESVSWKYETLKQQACELYATLHVCSHFENALNLYTTKMLLSSEGFKG